MSSVKADSLVEQIKAIFEMQKERIRNTRIFGKLDAYAYSNMVRDEIMVKLEPLMAHLQNAPKSSEFWSLTDIRWFEELDKHMGITK